MRNYPNLCKVTTNLRHGGSLLQENTSNEENLSFLFQYAELQIVDVIVSDSCINLYCNARKDYAVCPYCGKVSSKAHSRYIRTITDLPILGKTCILHVKVRKVNKLKEVKRTMYGKAKLELLKRKMMLEYTYFN